jgi:hypothetical protein
MNKQVRSIAPAEKKAPAKTNGKAKSESAKTPSIEDIQKALDDQIGKFQRKSELISNREKFIESKDKLTRFLKEQGSDYNESLDSEILRIVLSNNSRYNNSDHLSIANNMIVREFIEFAIRKIDQKVLEIEKKILG